MSTCKSLFDLVAPEEKRNEFFEHLRSEQCSVPARMMMDELFQDFEDPDGNFIEQFQTTGFNARIFEFYLFAYLQRSGFAINRDHEKPDFLVSRNGVEVSIEATTVNPAGRRGAVAEHGRIIDDLSKPSDFKDYEDNELPIRFGSPIFTKLGQDTKYWELEHCRDRPFVLAIEAFHDPQASSFAENALAQYLYGFRQVGQMTQMGELRIKSSRIESFSVGDKTIPSGLFESQSAENLSAVLFTNSGTKAKFTRMGYQSGFGCDKVHLERFGYCVNPVPHAMDPTFFRYSLASPPMVETWGQGLVVMHNPNALHPLPKDFFKDAAQMYVEGKSYQTEYCGWHPLQSNTLNFEIGESIASLKRIRHPLFAPTAAYSIVAIPRADFHAIYDKQTGESSDMFQENGWFADLSKSFLGVVIYAPEDSEWGFVVLARDPYFRFRPILTVLSKESRTEARNQLQFKMAELVTEPQRIFKQED